MKPEIISHALLFAESEAEVNSLRDKLRAAISKLSSIEGLFESLLLEAEIYEPIAIPLDESQILICKWDGECNYHFSIVRNYS